MLLTIIIIFQCGTQTLTKYTQSQNCQDLNKLKIQLFQRLKDKIIALYTLCSFADEHASH